VHTTSYYIYFNFSTCFGQLCASHQETLLYLCDTANSHSVWFVWSAGWDETHPNQQARQPTILTYLLTYSTVQSPSWEANRFAASQETPRISRNPKVNYRTHKRPPPVSILGQPNLVHIPTSHLLKIHPNIIHPSTPRSPQWSPSLRFPQQDPSHPYRVKITSVAQIQ